MLDSIYTNQFYEYRKNQEQLNNLKAKATSQKKAGINGQIDKQSNLYKVCVEFEAIFIKQMLKVMKNTVKKSEFLNGGFAEDIFEDMLYDEYANKMAENAELGLAEMVYRDLIQD
jgi:Rod binding domain-containing protein